MSNNISAILWFILSIGVCIFAVLLAAHWGAFELVPINNPQLYNVQSSVENTFNQSTTIECMGDMCFNESQKQKIGCIFRLGMWC